MAYKFLEVWANLESIKTQEVELHAFHFYEIKEE